MKHKVNITKNLSHIYRAKDCCDICDVEQAEYETRKLLSFAQKQNHATKAIYRRLSSLLKKRNDLNLVDPLATTTDSTYLDLSDPSSIKIDVSIGESE